MRFRYKRRLFCWIYIWSILQLILSEDVSALDTNFSPSLNDNPIPPDLRSLFSPRMDYDQWKPLGRGDPLKNDPTYDYVPPVLDKVHYWLDPSLRKPDPPTPEENQKTEILLLGVSSKKPSTGTSIADSRKDDFDSFLKLVEGPKFTSPKRPHVQIGSSYFPPSFYSNNKNSYSKTNEPGVPYTILMPPPPPPVQNVEISETTPIDTVTATMLPETNTVTVKPDSDVTVQAANLVYQSSSLSSSNDWKTTESTNVTSINSMFNPTNKLQQIKEDALFQDHLQLPEPYIQIPFAPANATSLSLVTANSDHNINFVTPPPLNNKEIMHKGQVSDDSLDISNTYVKIGKTEAQVHSTGMDNIPNLPTAMLMAKPPNIIEFSPIDSPMTQIPLTMQTIHSMQSMHPPPATTSPVFKKSTNPIKQALEKEKTAVEKTTTTKIEISTASSVVSTTLPTTRVTEALTAGSFLKSYKQSPESSRNPLYLIIQGHSKVKTYGPSKQYHGIRVQETNEISDEKEEVPLKHLHNYLKKDNNSNLRRGKSGNLLTLKHVIQTGLGAIDFSDEETEKRTDEGLKEAELRFAYKVGEDMTSEKYYKGIVEEARKLRIEA